jgi:hypothetical protein
MQVASVTTFAQEVRSKIDGWSSNTGEIFIGYILAPKAIPYMCVQEMLTDGWELLGLPQREEWEADGKQHVQWRWWFQRKCPQLQRRYPPP